jgi:hypothetical protein
VPDSVAPTRISFDPVTGELDAEAKTAAVLAMRADSSVVAAVGRNFDVVSVEGMFLGTGDDREVIDVSFLIRTASPVVLPAGTMTSVGLGEGKPPEFGPLPMEWAPHADYYVVPLPEPAVGFLFLIKP